MSNNICLPQSSDCYNYTSLAVIAIHNNKQLPSHVKEEYYIQLHDSISIFLVFSRAKQLIQMPTNCNMFESDKLHFVQFLTL